MIKILIVEDQTIVRDSLCHNFSAQEDFSVVGSTGNAGNAFSLCRERNPDLILMDVCTENNANGIDAAEKIKREFPDKKIVIMTGLMDVTFLDRARQANVDSFLYKNISLDDMITTVRSTMMGYGTYPNEKPREFAKDLLSLTEREMAIFTLICDGKNRQEISEEFNLSESSVKTYTSTILSKTGFHSTSKLAIYAISQGYINPKI